MTPRRIGTAAPDAAARGAVRQASVAGPASTAGALPGVRSKPSAGGPDWGGRTLLQLQRERGNRYVGRLIDHARAGTSAPPMIQAKLMLGPPGDRYEREADQVARQVTRGATLPGAAPAGGGRAMPVPDIQRVRGAGALDSDALRGIEGTRGGGHPLPDHVRRPMEQALGADFGGVRLHTDARADQLTRSVRAQAFTTGQDIFFRHGQYHPSGPGREVLAHELTHVVQQGGPLAAPGSGLVQRRMGFEFETNVEVRGTFRAPWPQPQQGQPAGQGQAAAPGQAAAQGQRGQQGQRGGRGRQGQQGRGGQQRQQGRQGQGQQGRGQQGQGQQGQPGQRQRQPDWRASIGLFDDEEEFYRPAGAQWKIVPDTGRMEFVTDPLDTLVQLQAACTQIENFINGLQNVPRERDIRATNPGTWTAPATARNGYTVHVGADVDFGRNATEVDWYGQPQVSVGVLTQRVSRFFAQARDTNQLLAGLQGQINLLVNTPQEPPMPTKGVPAGVQDMTQLMASWNTKLLSGKLVARESFREANRLVAAHAPQLAGVEKDKLRSLWTLMRGYWNRLKTYTTTGEYIKSYVTAMARTDFHSFYSDLSPAGQQAFQAGIDDFAPQGGTEMIAGTGITLRRWYTSVFNPEPGSTNTAPGGNPRNVDLLSAQVSATNEALATATNKSMGQLPLDTTGGPARAVFELRRITPGARIPIRFMFPHVITPIFNLVTRSEQ
ncbi:MAG TPA: DUF4157 domain-containing protein [Streptosporangiaceae bacterium]|nr:DUF4157 domain-containing protein [Streptosporangiaceae bacterium]